MSVDDEREAQHATGHRIGPCGDGLERIGRREAQLTAAEAHQDEGHFVDAVDADQRGHCRVGEPGDDLGGHTMGIGGCQQVGQQRASVPPQVPPASLPVLPTGTEWDTGQHHGHVVAHVHTSPQRDEGVDEGVVMVHVVTHDIHLHRMKVAR